jgi:hypothetical protein
MTALPVFFFYFFMLGIEIFFRQIFFVGTQLLTVFEVDFEIRFFS